jgi:ABC-type hemin transport system ATPase subunit
LLLASSFLVFPFSLVKNVTRLGKKPEEKGKSSPMKVIFEDERPKVS